ncbi:hypothetical protein MLD38_016687 [Melastoma candidum]|uniref:Uncharacterized protein n=1 Tax=Melastoma candidum TaxID=119954 RepID=A0ACB9QN78_9MYRT|nr:hypothetical protein MLD38_016687 [Melastoma candidum]
MISSKAHRVLQAALCVVVGYPAIAGRKNLTTCISRDGRGAGDAKDDGAVEGGTDVHMPSDIGGVFEGELPGGSIGQ